MTADLIEKIANLGVLGLMLALCIIVIVKVGGLLIEVFKDRITFLETGTLKALDGLLKALDDHAARSAEHDRKSSEAHNKQQEALDRIERKVDR